MRLAQVVVDAGAAEVRAGEAEGDGVFLARSRRCPAVRSTKMRLRVSSLSISSIDRQDLVEELLQHRSMNAVGQVAGLAADARVAGGEARAGELLDEVVDLLALGEGVEEDGHRAAHPWRSSRRRAGARRCGPSRSRSRGWPGRAAGSSQPMSFSTAGRRRRCWRAARGNPAGPCRARTGCSACSRRSSRRRGAGSRRPGSALVMISPSISRTRRSTPWVAGWRGPHVQDQFFADHVLRRHLVGGGGFRRFRGGIGCFNFPDCNGHAQSKWGGRNALSR